MPRIASGKYTQLIIAIAVFIALDAGVLGLNFYTSYKIADNAHAIHLANRQSMLTQKIFHRVALVNNDLETQQSFIDNSSALSISFKQFEEVLDAFIYGGALIGEGQGQDLLLTKDEYQDLSKQYLTEAEQLWQPYRKLVSPLVYAEYLEDTADRSILLESAQKAVSYAQQNGEELLAAVQNFAIAIERKARDQAEQLRLVQAIGIMLAVITFLIIVFYFLRNLSRSDQAAAEARRETREILSTVNDGLFLLDTDHRIGSQYSTSMKTLFKRDNFADVDFFQLLKPLVSESVLSTTTDYVDMLFNERVNSNLMHDLNPLQEVEINIGTAQTISTHYFRFNFSRVYVRKRLAHLLVTVTDVTENVQLRSDLAKADRKINQELELMLSIMHLDRQMVEPFLQTLDDNLNAINHILQLDGYENHHYQDKLLRISRLVHTLKGESAALGLRLIEDKLHSMEDTLELLREKPVLQGDDFLALTVQLNNLMALSPSIRSVVDRFANLDQSETRAANDGNENTAINWHPMLNDLVAQAGSDCGKQAKLDVSEFDINLIPTSTLATVKDTLIQFIRNAVVHGIEVPERRSAMNKPETGTIKIATHQDIQRQQVLLTVRDDGGGIDFPAIRQRLEQSGVYSAEQVTKIPTGKLAAFLFEPGFSTAGNVDRHAGRGIGLDLVKASLTHLGASLSLRYQDNEFTEFRVRIPVDNKAAIQNVA